MTERIKEREYVLLITTADKSMNGVIVILIIKNPRFTNQSVTAND